MTELQIGDHLDDEIDRTFHWTPSRKDAISINLLGVIVTAAGIIAYGAVAGMRYASGSFEIGVWGILGMLVTLAVLLLAHEALHGVAIRLVGARPTFGVGVAGGGFLPYAYTTATGHRFTLHQYLIVAIAPTVVLITVTIALVLLAPGGGWYVVPSAIHLGGCVGDWWLMTLARRQPRGSQFEDLKDGLLVHLP